MRFDHVCIIVKVLNRSLKFCKGLFGLKVVKIFTAEGNCPQTIYNIKGLKITYAKLRAPHGRSKLCFCYGPDKNLIEFVEDINNNSLE